MVVGAHAPTFVDHCYDSARQPWLHTHLLLGLWRPPSPAH